MASEKRPDRLRKWIGISAATAPQSITPSRQGKNHWDRMTQDLQAQKLLNGFLQHMGVRVAGKNAEMVRLVAEIREHQAEDEKTLTRLISLADPQAGQS